MGEGGRMLRFIFAAGVLLVSGAAAQQLGAQRVTPNLAANIERPLRYRPDGEDFVIENGAEYFNRSLYGGNTAFRVDGGDKPEFVLYLPGRGGNLRFGFRTPYGAKWLQDTAHLTMRYRPGELFYEIRDPMLGRLAVIRLTALAYDRTEGLIVRAESEGLVDPTELVWAYGGVNGQRGKRDGDIGTENVPISEWFQLRPEFCRDNKFEVGGAAGGFTLEAKAAIIQGLVPAGTQQALADAEKWKDITALLASAEGKSTPALPVMVGHVTLVNGQPLYVSLQRASAPGASAGSEDLDTYKEVGAPSAASPEAKPKNGAKEKAVRPAIVGPDALSALFAVTEQHFTALRTHVAVDTPDPFINAAAGALNVVSDALWDETQQDIMHGSIAWRTRLLGWRGPYSLDALGWHDRAEKHFNYWAGRQNTSAIPEKVPPPDASANLARNEKGLHTNGDMSNSHYDMNLVAIDALFRHLLWTGDVEFAKKMWPIVERHLAWERRLFRREYGPEKLPLYEAYAAIWASDDLQYSGGGTTHASAYNYYHNRMAARVATLVGADPAPYTREADLIGRAMRELLWLKEDGAFAEYKDWLGLQLVHPDAAVWSFYHTMDSEVPTPKEAQAMTQRIDATIPHIPVRGAGVPEGLYTLASSDWMPYDWSINNVVMAEAVHTALGYWQAGRPDEAFRITKGSVLAAMYMGISPGNVGTMSYLDVYRRESQRDFGDGTGVLSRALVEGLFGVKPDLLAGELRIEPGFPVAWDHAALKHPDLAYSFKREGERETYAIEPHFSKTPTVRLRIPARREEVTAATLNGQPVKWEWVREDGRPARVEIVAPAAARTEIALTWSGAAVTPEQVVSLPALARGHGPVAIAPRTAAWGLVDISAQFNDRVAQIFRNEYKAPRSPFVSLGLPKQGLGGWAGGVNTTAQIDDSGLRAAAKNEGRLVLPDGLIFLTPGDARAKNVIFTSRWENYPAEVTVPLEGRAGRMALLMAGSTDPMQTRVDNGEVVVTYTDGTTDRLALRNPETWWPIEQDYFVDDFQFRYDGVLPVRVDLRTGKVRELNPVFFKGQGGKIPGGAATVLELPLQLEKELKSVTVRALANDVVIGLMAVTLGR